MVVIMVVVGSCGHCLAPSRLWSESFHSWPSRYFMSAIGYNYYQSSVCVPRGISLLFLKFRETLLEASIVNELDICFVYFCNLLLLVLHTLTLLFPVLSLLLFVTIVANAVITVASDICCPPPLISLLLLTASLLLLLMLFNLLCRPCSYCC